MQVGKLVISRGMEAKAGEREPSPMLEALPTIRPLLVPVSGPAATTLHPATLPFADYHLVRQRLDALERLGVLRDIGVLSSEEFAAEKALVLRLPADELQLCPEEMLGPRGPSLLGRLLNWKLLAAGMLVGLALSAFSAPNDLIMLADRASRLIG